MAPAKLNAGDEEDLEAVSLPLDDVIVADDARMHEAADVVQVFGSWAPSGFVFSRKPSEAAVIIGDKVALFLSPLNDYVLL